MTPAEFGEGAAIALAITAGVVLVVGFLRILYGLWYDRVYMRGRRNAEDLYQSHYKRGLYIGRRARERELIEELERLTEVMRKEWDHQK